MQSLAFLVVDDDPSLAGAVERHLRASYPCVVAHDVRAALQKLTEGDAFCGFVIDLGLPDGSGLDILREARARYPNSPAMLLTGTIEPELINETYQLGASFVAKPIGTRALARFVTEANACAFGIDPVMQRRVADVVARCALTPAERDILLAKLAAVAPEEYMQARDITLNTYKSQVRTLIRKLGVDSLEGARRVVLTDGMAFRARA